MYIYFLALPRTAMHTIIDVVMMLFQSTEKAQLK
jgi:hypothetical protein